MLFWSKGIHRVTPGAGQGEVRELLVGWKLGNTPEPFNSITPYSVGCIPIPMLLATQFSSLPSLILFAILTSQATREKFVVGEKQPEVLFCQ